MNDNAIDFSPLKRAIGTLQQAYAQPPQNDLERDGAIQRFEYTFELCWKMIRRTLLALGRSQVSGSPKPLFRAALEEHWIDDVAPWFAFLEARNQVSHAYSTTLADEVYENGRDLPQAASSLLERLVQASCHSD